MLVGLLKINLFRNKSYDVIIMLKAPPINFFRVTQIVLQM